MAQKWAISSIITASISSALSYQYQNEIARFLWPQIPDTATPYPGGILFPDYDREKPPQHNHSLWGIFMFPIAGISSYYIMKYTIGWALAARLRRKYRTGPLTPRWMSLTETFRVWSPKITQCCIPLTISIPFATTAKIYRDGPGYYHDREFYRTGHEDPAWDYLDYDYYPEPERAILDHPLELLHVIHGEPHANPGLDEDNLFPVSVVHPKAEQLEEESIVAWYNAQLGIDVEKPRELPKKWLKLLDDYDEYTEPDTSYMIPNAAGAHRPSFKYNPKTFEVDSNLPPGQLPTFGATDNKGIRLPWRAMSPTIQHLAKNQGYQGGFISEEEFFDPFGTNEKALREWADIETGLGVDIDGRPVEVASKYIDILRANAVKPGEMDAFALEKRKAKEDLNNPWQAFYYHPTSIVGRDIPENARIQVSPNHEKVPWRLDSDVEEEWRQTQQYARETLEDRGDEKRIKITPASTQPVYMPPNTAVTPAQYKTVLHGTPTNLKLIRRLPSGARSSIINDADLDPQQRTPIPGYQWGVSHVDLLRTAEKLDIKHESGGKVKTLPVSWFPHEVKGLVKNRHQYYTGRGARYANEKNLFTGEIVYDPNNIPGHPHGLTMSIQEAEDYYTEAQRDDYEYAKQVAGSFQKLYGVPFPKFDEPNLYDENTVVRYPHLATANKRLEMQTRYFNSLEDRIMNPPLEPTLSPHEKKLKQTQAQILRNDFNPLLYRTSIEYRGAWQEKYPALKQLGKNATPDQLDYVLSFAAPRDLSKGKRRATAPALVPSYQTDRWVKESVDNDVEAQRHPGRIFEQYSSDLAKSRHELTPRDLLQHEKEHKERLTHNQPISDLQLRQERIY